MNYRVLSAGVLVATLLGVGGAAAQTVYVESYSSGPIYAGPPSHYVVPGNTYVIEEQRVVPSYPVPPYPPVTYERQVVAPSGTYVAPAALPAERRVIQSVIDDDGASYAAETDGSAASCGYDAFGRLICD